MAQRMLVILSEPSSLSKTMRELVAPVVAMFAPIASSSSSWEEAEDSLQDAHRERMEVKEESVSGTRLTDGLIDTANELREKYSIKTPPKTIYLFSARGAKAEVDPSSHILTCKISCDSPPRNMKDLITAIHYGFAPELNELKIIVSGMKNKIEMRYRGRPLFKCGKKSAESLIPYAVGAARNLWLRALQQQLIEDLLPTKREAYARCVRSAALNRQLYQVKRLGLQKHGLRADYIKLRADYIDRVFYPSGRKSESQRVNMDAVEKMDLGDWKKKLTEELVHHWWEGSTRRKCWVTAAFRCSGSKGHKRIEWSAPTIFASNIKDYICFQMQKHTSQNIYEPEVIIQMLDKSWSYRKSPNLLVVPLTDKICAIENLDEATGNWISISDADGPGLRRVLLCRSSNFHEVFSDFLETTDFFKSRDNELPDRSALGKLEEGSRSPIDENIKSAATHLEDMEIEIGRVPGNSWTDGLMEVANKHMEENPDEQSETSPSTFDSSYRELPDISAFCAQTSGKLEEGSRSLMDENIQPAATHLESTNLPDPSIKIALEHMQQKADGHLETRQSPIGISNRELPDKSSFLSEKLSELVETL